MTLLEQITNLRNRLASIDTYYTTYSRGKVFHTSVKTWKYGKDLDQILADMKLNSAQERAVRDYLTEEYQSDLLYTWLDNQYHYFAEFLEGYTHDADNTPEQIKTIKVYSIPFGLCGRSGGHFYIGKYDDVEDLLYRAEEYLDEDIGEATNAIAEATNYLDAVEWALNEASTQCKQLIFGDELRYRVEEYLTEGIAEEIASIEEEIKALQEKRDNLQAIITMENVPL